EGKFFFFLGGGGGRWLILLNGLHQPIYVFRTFFFLSSQRLIFDLPIFHPLVDPVSGELDVKRAFAKWRRNHNHIWQILMYARRVFYKIDTTSPLNPESAVLYEKDIQLFKSKVVDSVKLCSSHLFDPPKIEDPHAISFSPWNPAIHNEVREKMLTQKVRREHLSYFIAIVKKMNGEKSALLH
ncbi:AKT-interacting protein-like, partial [Notechis scutatus]|uniref:AKT-interacting protein-like n=1 Tax=Notechis scutatus TaxID=8663 RepID=A0A6J1W2F6_9SAUR